MKNRILTLLFLCLFMSQLYGQIEEKSNKVFLVWGGKTGWIGQKIVALLKEQKFTVYSAEARLENREEIENEIKLKCPNYIINCAGVTGTPNVDWCEDHQQQTIRTNIIGAL